MRKEILGVCPVCSGAMHVRELGCRNCEITIHGDFELSPFNALTKEELRFLEIFVRNTGNLKDVQAELGLSYPTVKKTLDNVVRSLGYDVKPESISDVDDADVIGKLKNKEISVEEDIEKLKAGRKMI